MIIKVPYGGYVIWASCGLDYEIYDIEKPGWDYAVATFGTIEDAKKWIDENPDGDAVVAQKKAELDIRQSEYLIDVICG